jgi:hypothetical protein
VERRTRAGRRNKRRNFGLESRISNPCPFQVQVQVVDPFLMFNLERFWWNRDWYSLATVRFPISCRRYDHS